jgi:hypothetical protein
MERRWIAAAVTGWLIAVSSTAGAAESREVREREARKACFTGNVDRGVELLVDLYGETGHPNYIFNQARCFERNGKYDQALLSYEDYLRKATNLGDAERAQVEKSIAELRPKVGARTPAPPSGAATAGGPGLLTPSLEGDGTKPGANPNDNALLPMGAADKTGADAWPWQRKAGVISLVVAGGALAVGVAGHVLHETRAGDFNDVCTISNGVPMPAISESGADCRGKRNGVEAAERMMWIGYVGAGVFAAAGVTLVLLAPRADRTGAIVASRCGPMLAAAGGPTGVVCGWSF